MEGWGVVTLGEYARWSRGVLVGGRDEGEVSKGQVAGGLLWACT